MESLIKEKIVQNDIAMVHHQAVLTEAREAAVAASAIAAYS